jgi:hypothetical protein
MDFGRSKHFFAANGNTTLNLGNPLLGLPLFSTTLYNTPSTVQSLLDLKGLEKVDDLPPFLIYPHNLFKNRPYDGILVSKAFIDSCIGNHKRNRKTLRKLIRKALRKGYVPAKQEKRIWKLYKQWKRPTMRNQLLAPTDLPIMGDCGAFSFVTDDKPPYTTDEVIDFYEKYGFTQGVSVDHLILDFVEDKQFRFDLTLQNARDFIAQCTKQKANVTPIASLQGWNVTSYARAARECAKMGYKYMAVGGIVKSTTEYIMRILAAIQEEFDALGVKDIKLHLFGVTRFQALPVFAKMGAYSFDSTSVYVASWMREDTNYLTADGWHGCIRLPVVSKKMRGMEPEELEGLAINPSNLKKKSYKLLRKVARFGLSEKTKVPSKLVDRIVELNLAAYPLEEHEVKPLRSRIKRVLLQREWKRCPCRACKALGPGIMVLYGKDLTAARAMHNLNSFHNYIFPRIMEGETFSFLTKTGKPLYMRPIFELPPE